MVAVLDLRARARRAGRRRVVRIALLATCLAAAACSSKPSYEAPEQPAIDPKLFAGNWIAVDHDTLGHAIYVDKGSIRDAQDRTKVAKIALVDQDSRMLQNLSVDCSTRGVIVASQVGTLRNTAADLTGDIPRESGPHSSTVDYICTGKLSEPEASEKPMSVPPAHI